MNQRNNFSLIGRLTKDPIVYDNKDGSKKIRMTIATRDNYQSTNSNGNKGYGSQFVPVEAFVSTKMIERSGLGIYANLHKGSLIGVTGSIQNDNFVDKDGQPHYNLVLRIETKDMLETKAAAEERMARQVVGDEGEMFF